MGDERSGPAVKKNEVVLRDLDILLRRKLGNNLIVDSFTTSNLVPPGENYGSTMLKVDAEVRREGLSSELEKLSLVAKMIPPTEFQKIMFDSPFTFRKEIYMFTKIVPAFKALELECGIPETEVFDLLPEFYGSRLSLNGQEEEFDDDAVILMENLKIKNYACVNRQVGLSLRHAETVVKALAHFHALGIALKLKKPDFFEEVKIQARCMNFSNEFWAEFVERILGDAKKIPDLIPHVQKIEEVLRNTCNLNSWLATPSEPWGTIAHTDFWINNVMLRDDESGNTLGVKFIDFQNYLYQNPIRDLIFFIFSSCTKTVRLAHVDKLLNLYYEQIVFYLGRLECDQNLFPRESFDKQLLATAKEVYGHCIAMSRVILTEPSDPGVTDLQVMFDGDSSDRCRERMAEITLKFIERNWI